MEDIFQHLFRQLQQNTQASEQNCRQLAGRIVDEITRICRESQRIQKSGDIQGAAKKLAESRLQKCLLFYHLGSSQGRIELHSTLSAIIYRHISPHQGGTSYHARLTLIEDFIQGFYIEALNSFRKEAQLEKNYHPETRLQIAEYIAFCDRYAKRRIPLSRGRSQQLIILRAQTFSKQYPSEALVDIDLAAEGGISTKDNHWGEPILQELQKIMAHQINSGVAEDNLRKNVKDALIQYLEGQSQKDCADYFALLVQDTPTKDIEKILNLNARERDYLQQRFKYHLLKFIFSSEFGDLVHQWLEADLEHNLGLSPHQWQQFLSQLNPSQSEILKLRQQEFSNHDIALKLSLDVNQVNKQWSRILKFAWEIRNRSS